MSISGSRNSSSAPTTLSPTLAQRPPSPPSPLAIYAHKMKKEGIPAQLIQIFSDYFSEISQLETGHIPEEDITPINESDLQHIDHLKKYEAYGKSVAKAAIAIKLNGGLGTSMGMQFAKSLLPVKDKKTFLDITIQQALTMQKECGGALPLALMNSYNTHEDTINELRHMDGLSQLPLCFAQHKFPKIAQGTLMPAEYPENPEYEWNPPGHGDIFATLHLSGVLDTLIRQGRKYALVSNIDNLGATIDMRLLGYMAKENLPFLMEVTERTINDSKGGHLAKHTDGRLILREIGQCAECDREHFQNIERHSYFNTNNIWINLLALKDNLTRHGIPKLPLILSPKPVNPHDSASQPAYQVESAMGAAISYFPNAQAVITTRDRFIPVKQTEDLLKVMSDYYLLEPSGKLSLNTNNISDNLQVRLDPKYYRTFDNIYDRFKDGIPSLTACSTLNIYGDIVFTPTLSLQGNVTIDNRTGNILHMPENLTLQGTVNIG